MAKFGKIGQDQPLLEHPLEAKRPLDPKEPYFLNNNGLDQTYTNNFDTHTHHSFGAPTKSMLTIKPVFDGLCEKHINEIAEQLTQKNVKLTKQPKFKFQIGFFCHL